MHFSLDFEPHSTKTELVKVINTDIHLSSDTSKTSVLVLLDLSAAFDAVDCKILLEQTREVGGTFWHSAQLVQILFKR